MGPTWVLSAPDGPHVGPMNLDIRVLHIPVEWRTNCRLDSAHSAQLVYQGIPYPEPVYTGMPLGCHWLTQCTLGYHWATQPILAGYTGTPLEKLSWNSPTLECHWRNLVESAPHWDATGETLTFATYTGTPLEGLWQPTHAPTHIVKHAE